MTSATIAAQISSDVTLAIGSAENWEIVRLAEQAAAKQRLLNGDGEEHKDDSAPTAPRSLGLLQRLWDAGAVRFQQAVQRTLFEDATSWSEPEATGASRELSSCQFAEPEDLLDWDFCLETPPPRPRWEIKVTLINRGRGKPLPAEDPWA